MASDAIQVMGLRQRIVDLIRRLFWVRSYEVALVPAGANGVEDFLDGVKSLGGAGGAAEGEKWVRLGEALMALGTGLKSVVMPGTETLCLDQAMADALDAVMEELGALGAGVKSASPVDLATSLTRVSESVHALKIEGLMLQGRDPAAAKSILGLCGSISAALPLEEDVSAALGEKGMPAAGKPGGHRSPPKGYPTDPGQYLDPKNWRYRIDNEGVVHAAITYLSREKPGGPGGYTREELVWMWNRLRKAAKKYDIELSPDTGIKTGESTMSAPIETPVPGAQPVEGIKDGAVVAPAALPVSTPAAVAPPVPVETSVKATPPAGPVTPEQPPITPGSLMPPPADPGASIGDPPKPVDVPKPQPANAVDVPNVSVLLKGVDEKLTDICAKMAVLSSIPAQITALEARMTAAEKATADAVAASVASVAAAAVVRTEGEKALAGLLAVPGAAPMVADGVKKATGREDINEEDYGKSARVKTIREGMKKGGGMPPMDL